MKLQKFTVKNFRWLKGDKNIIDFSGSEIIFLLWQNNIWKSSFLRAYEFFIEAKQKAVKTDFYNYNLSIPIEIEAEFLLEEWDETDDELMTWESSREPTWLRDNWADSNWIVKVKKVWVREGDFAKYTFKPTEEDWVLNWLGWLHQHLTSFAPTPIAINAMETEDSLEEKVNKIINDDFLKTAKTDFADVYSNAENAVKELQNRVLSSAGIQNMNRNINVNFKKLFSNLELEIKPKNEEIKLVDTIKKNHSINVKKEWWDRDETFRQNGHGIIRQALFNFLTFLKEINWATPTTRKEYIILFEEPELFLHPKVAYILRRSLYELAMNSTYQILCASHSPLMIDISKPKSSIVRICKHLDETTETYQVGDELFQKNEESKKMVQMANRMNTNVCEVFYADKVILVEWDTEAIVFRDLLDRFYQTKEIYVLNTWSKNNIPFFQEILSHFKIKHFVIHDTDTSDKVSSWSLNQRIQDRIVPGLSTRYVFKDTFETAHNYSVNLSKGKPLSAFEYVQLILSPDEQKDCVVYLKDIASSSQSINHTQEYISSLFV